MLFRSGGSTAERPRFPGPLLRRTRGPDPSSKATLFYDFKQGCIYWSGSLSHEYGEGVDPGIINAKCFYLINGDTPILISDRSEGMSVRPVVTNDAPVE